MRIFAKLVLVFALMLSGAARASITVDSAAKRSESGSVGIEVTFKGVGAEGIVFEVAFDTMRMDPPPLDSYDLSKLARLVVDGGAPVSPSSWTIRETGHMGHHLRGRLVFPSVTAGRPVLGPGAKALELRIAGLDGQAQQVFSWSIVAR